jgi:Icc-related predicted phosphoesterase
MSTCVFVSDLHGRPERYQKLFALIAEERPQAVFLGGDLIQCAVQAGGQSDGTGAVDDVLARGFQRLRRDLVSNYPDVFVIMGNDDLRALEPRLIELETHGLWHYAHARRLSLGRFDVYGYAYVPPTPFMLKDWERYDVSAYVDPGCVPPNEGWRSVAVDDSTLKFATIAEDLDRLVGDDSLDNAILLCHSPPYRTNLDRAALDGKSVDHVPLDVHVGSIALRRLIEKRQPLLTLHGHVHEAARLSGSWRDRIGRTHLFSAAHDGPELAVVRFALEDLEAASRELR